MFLSHAQFQFYYLRGISQTDKEKSRLFCWQEFKKHPSFLIGPMKMEFVHRNPDVVMVSRMENPGKFKI